MKEWQNIKLIVNNLEIEVRYSRETIQKLFIPLLKKWTDIYREKKERIVIFLAAPPGVGKTTLSQYLEQLSRELSDVEEIQGIGIDGFHYKNEYLETNFIEKDDERINLKKIKGAPETFNYKSLREKLENIKNDNILWPIYDRKLHDIKEDKIRIEKNIILLEGNWLLLAEEEWGELKNYADYSILIRAKEELLRERLIERKILGGSSREEAIVFYESSDKKNILRVLNKVVEHNLTLEMKKDDDYERVGDQL